MLEWSNLCFQWIETLAGSERQSNFGVKRFSYHVMGSVSTTDAGVRFCKLAGCIVVNDNENDQIKVN